MPWYTLLAGLLSISVILAAVLVTARTLFILRQRSPRVAGWISRPIIICVVAAIVGVFGFGLCSMQVAVTTGDAIRRQDFLQRTVMAATLLDATAILRLRGTPADIPSPAYRQLLTQLMAYNRSVPYSRWTDLFGLRGRNAIVLLDADEHGETPGTIDNNVTEPLRYVFRTGTPAINVPMSGRGRTWISALVPIRHPDTGQVVAVFAVNIDAAVWDARILSYRLNSILLTLLLAGITAITFGSLFWYHHKHCTTARQQHHYARLQQCFLAFTPDPLENINALTAVCGELLGADCALYNRLIDGQLVAWGQWHTPPGFQASDNPEGHICFDVIQRSSEDSVLYRDLSHTTYAQTDPTVAQYHLQTYLGLPVFLDESPVGSLCAVFTDDFVPTVSDRTLISIIAAAIGVEESRKHAKDLLVFQRHFEQQVAGENELLPALSRCLNMALQVSGMDGGGIHLLDSTAKKLELIVSQGLSERFCQAVYEYPLDSDRGRLLSAGHPVYPATPELMVQIAPPTQEEGLHAIGLIPIMSDEGLLGSLNVASYHRDIDHNIRGTLETIARQIGGIVTRVQLRERLYTNEARLRTVLDSIPDCVWLKDPQGVYLGCNTRFMRFVGANEAEIIGKTDHDLVDAATADFFREKDRVAIAAGKPTVNDEVIIFADDGHQEHVETTKTPLYDTNGLLIGVLGIAHDITERFHHEAALQESEERFRLLAQSIPVGISISDAQEGHILYVNPKCDEIFGYRLDDAPTIAAWMARACPDEMYHRQVSAQMDADMQRMRAGDLRYCPEREYHLVTADGTVKEIVVTLVLSNELLYATFTDITVRKQAEMALRQSEERYHLLADNAGEIVWTTDLAGRFTYISPSVERIRGFKPADIIGRSFNEMMPPESTTQMGNALREELDQEREDADPYRTRVLEIEVFHRDGTRHWVEATMTFLYDAAGIPAGVLGVSRDVTERRRMFEALNWDEELLRAMANCSPLAFFVVDNRTDKILYANHRFCELWELTAIEEAIHAGAMTNNAIIPYCIPLLADVEGFAVSCKPLQSEENRAIIEDEIPFRDGRVIRRFSTQIRDAADRYFGRFYLFEDITVRKHYETELTYRLTFEDLIATLSTRFINCALTAIDEEITHALGTIGTFTHADRAYVFIFTADEFMDNTHEWCAEEITPEIDNLQHLPVDIFPWWMTRLHARETIHVPRVTDLPSEADAEREILQAQAIQSVIVLPLIEEEQLIGFLGFDAVQEERQWTKEVVRLLTMVGDLVVNALARKRTGEQLHSLHVDLDRRLRELDAANHDLEAFSYSVSHDLRAPLWNITSFSEALEQDIALSATEDTRDLISRIQQASQRMTELIDALLSLSRLTREHITLVPCSLSEMAQEIMETLQHTDSTRHVTATITPDITTSADPRLLRIALENLLGNAWKYTAKCDHAHITFSVIEEKGERVYCIQDNGAGFNMAHYERLFTPFQRLHREQDFPGSGIGLATVQRIIHRHGGRIWAEGHIGQGATFYFTLGTTTPAQAAPVEIKV